MLILYGLKWYKFDPELPSALDMLAVAIQSSICFSFLLLLLFYSFLPPPERGAVALQGWVVVRLSPREGCRFPGGEMLLRDTLSVAHPGFAHTRSPGIFHTSLQPIPSHWGSLHPISWCTTSLNPVFQHIPATFLFSPAQYYCSVLLICFISPLPSSSLWEEYHARNQLFTFEDSPEQRSGEVLCVQCLQVLGLCPSVSSA